ncbi:MAG: SPOR domain-containing protein [Pseudomonadota bacterium]|nr:SPOR domain-containing protein [Pseudomonadota bacterium]
MTRDYKGNAASKSRRRKSGSCFFWFVSGAVLGSFGVGLAWMLEGGLQPPATSAPAAQSRPEAPTKPRFDFYNILPEMEVVVPDEELAATAAPPPKPPAPKPGQAMEEKKAAKPPKTVSQQAATPAQSRTGYLLQVASFRRAADAERVKAQLALLGISAQIQRVTINNKDTFHRVRAGPYRGKDALNQARALLSRNGLESIAIKLK